MANLVFSGLHRFQRHCVGGIRSIASYDFANSGGLHPRTIDAAVFGAGRGDDVGQQTGRVHIADGKGYYGGSRYQNLGTSLVLYAQKKGFITVNLSSVDN